MGSQRFRSNQRRGKRTEFPKSSISDYRGKVGKGKPTLAKKDGKRNRKIQNDSY